MIKSIFQDGFLLIFGDLGVVGELHGGVGATGGDGAESRDIAKHLFEGDFGVNCLNADFGVDALEHAAAAVEVAGDISDIGVGGENFELHDGFEEHGSCLAASFLEADLGADLEGELVGVDGMEGSVDDFDLEAVEGIACEYAVLHGFFETFLDGGHVFLGDVAAFDFADELKSDEAFVGGAEFEEDIGELTFTTGLLFVDFVVLDGSGDGFFVGYFGATLVDFDVELAAESVEDDVEMELAHAGDEGLTGDFVGFDSEGWVFLSELHEGIGQLVHVGLSVGLDGDADDGVGELHGFEDERVAFIAEGVAGLDVLESYGCSDIACLDSFDGVLLVAVHLHDAGDALFLAGVGVVDVGAGVEGAGIDAEEAETADIGVGGDLEGEGREGGLGIDGAGFGLIGLGVDAFDFIDIEGAGEEGANCVEQGLNTFVLEGGSAHDGNDLHGKGCLADFGDDLVGGDAVGVVEEFLHQGLVFLCYAFDEFLAVFGDDVLEVLGHGDFVELGAVGFDIPDESLVGDEVDDTFEEVFLSDGDLDGDGVGAEAFLDLADDVEEVGSGAVHLVDESDAGNAVFVGLTPNGLGLGLDAAYCAEDCDCAIEDAEGAFDLNGEVDVTRGVDDVEFVVVVVPIPEDGGSSGGDGDATFLLLNHPVHGSRTLMGLTQLVILARIKQDTLRRRSFACVDVGHNTDVSCVE